MVVAKQTKSGFSLIELIVVIAIIMIMTSLLLLVSSEDRTKRELETASRQLAVGLRQTQNFALTGKKQGTKRPCEFRFKPQNSVYSIDFDYYESGVDVNGDGIPNCEDATDYVDAVSASTLAQGVVISSGPELIFEVPYGTILDSNHSRIGTAQTYLLQKDALYYAVCVSPSGRIDEMGDVSTGGGATYTCP